MWCGSQYRNRLWRATTHLVATVTYVTVIRRCVGDEEGEPWDVRDQIIVFQVAVSFP